MRIGLILVTLFGQVVAPWLCCCVARAAVPVAKVETSQPVPPVSAAPRCPHCHAEPAANLPTSNIVVVSPGVPDQPKPCPCAALKRPDTPVVAPERLVIETGSEIVTSCVFPVDVLVATGFFDVARPVGLRDGPTLTTAERLYAHHVLRC